MPIDEPLPLSDVTKPMVMSACAAEAAKTPAKTASRLRFLRIAFSSVGAGCEGADAAGQSARPRTNRSKTLLQRQKSRGQREFAGPWVRSHGDACRSNGGPAGEDWRASLESMKGHWRDRDARPA